MTEDTLWRDVFADELAQIQDRAIREFVVAVLEREVDVLHKTQPASSTGKYHPPFANGEGGLVRHTKAVVWYAKQFMRARADLVEQEGVEDCVIAAAILHDMAKYHAHSVYTRHDHPAVMRSILINAVEDDEHYNTGIRLIDVERIMQLVETHMGQWTTAKNSSVVLSMPSNDLEWLFHYADYMASRRELVLPFDENNNLAL